MIVKYKSGISSQAEQLSNYKLFMNGTQIKLNNNWQIYTAALGATVFPFTSSSFNYMFPSIIRKIKYGFMNRETSIAKVG